MIGINDSFSLWLTNDRKSLEPVVMLPEYGTVMYNYIGFAISLSISLSVKQGSAYYI
jgi:hypothetical protein